MIHFNYFTNVDTFVISVILYPQTLMNASQRGRHVDVMLGVKTHPDPINVLWNVRKALRNAEDDVKVSRNGYFFIM